MVYVDRTDFEIWLDSKVDSCSFAVLAVLCMIVAGLYGSYYGRNEPFLVVIITCSMYLYLMLISVLFIYAAYVWSEY